MDLVAPGGIEEMIVPPGDELAYSELPMEEEAEDGKDGPSEAEDRSSSSWSDATVPFSLSLGTRSSSAGNTILS